MDRHEWYVDEFSWTGKFPGCEVNEAYRTDDLNGLSVVEAENGFYVIQDIEWQIQQGQLSQEWRRLIEVSGAYDEFTS